MAWGGCKKVGAGRRAQLKLVRSLCRIQNGLHRILRHIASRLNIILPPEMLELVYLDIIQIARGILIFCYELSQRLLESNRIAQ